MNHTPRHKEVLARLVKNVPTIRQDLTIGEVVNLLLEKARDFQTISYVYVVDQNNKLIGTVSVMEIFSLPKDRPVKDFMKRNIVTIHPNAHQERAAMLAIRHNIKSVPVVDKDGYFLGIIPSDAIMSILHEEHIEDALKAGGFTGTKGLMKDLISSYSYGTYFKKRLPWLIFGLIGGVMAALAIELFESTLKELLTLAAFVPAIVYMADAVGADPDDFYPKPGHRSKFKLQEIYEARDNCRRRFSCGSRSHNKRGFFHLVVAGFTWRDFRFFFFCNNYCRDHYSYDATLVFPENSR